MDLAAGGAPGAAGVGVLVPRAGKGAEVGPAAVSVRREHRADAAALVGVGADDHAVGADALKHAELGVLREGVDGVAKALGVSCVCRGSLRDQG